MEKQVNSQLSPGFVQTKKTPLSEKAHFKDNFKAPTAELEI
jgi:hypothetical protein